jgi:Zn-dependent protease
MSLITGLFIYIVIVLSATFHEYAHGFAAHALGDDTAKQMGRLTLNPIKHLDVWGTVVVPLLFILTAGSFIGWAKPVPYNPLNLRDKRYGSLKVAIAGPASNILIAIILGIALRFFNMTLIAADTTGAFAFELVVQLVAFIVYVNIFLALFNLIPVPPLDGSKIVFDLIPGSARVLERIGFFGVAIALLVAFYILNPVAQFLFNLITGVQIF